jgi:quercetin dioxygenase-like cupin family protein
MTQPSRLADRLVRYRDLVPCLNAFIDTRSPGSEAKENFTIIGPGVSENPGQHIHIAEPHGFNIGGARQPPHCVNSQHSHDTAEVFVVLSGTWSFKLGENGDEAAIRLAPGDIISLPTQMFRGFENIGTDIGFIWSVLGGDDPGRVLWAPYVFRMATDYGLMLMENGSLVDTVKGEAAPAGVAPMPVTSAEQIAKLQRLDAEAIRRCVVKADEAEFDTLVAGPLSAYAGVDERAVIGPDNGAEAIGAGKMGWSHGFQVRRLRFDAGAAVPAHVRDEPEVLFVSEGALTVRSGGETVAMGPGDTLTIPVGADRSFESAEGAIIFAVHGGDQPAAARMLATA